MTTTTTSVRPRGSRRISLEWIAPAILVLAALVLMVNLSALPGRDNVSFVNRSAAPVTVSVSDDARDSWLPVGTLDPGSRERVDAIIDQGGVWWFRLTVGPDRVGEIRRTADQLRAAGWTLTIPADVADNLREARRS
jgi:hypothetical protein